MVRRLTTNKRLGKAVECGVILAVFVALMEEVKPVKIAWGFLTFVCLAWVVIAYARQFIADRRR